MLRRLNPDIIAIHNIIIFKLLMYILLLDDILLMQLVVHYAAVKVHVAGLGLVFGLRAGSYLLKLLICWHVRLFGTTRTTDSVLVVMMFLILLMLMKLR